MIAADCSRDRRRADISECGRPSIGQPAAKLWVYGLSVVGFRLFQAESVSRQDPARGALGLKQPTTED